MRSKDFDFLGMTKENLILKMGDGFNFYPDRVWTYLVKVGFLRKKTYLVIFFENDIVIQVKFKKKYGNIKRSEL